MQIKLVFLVAKCYHAAIEIYARRINTLAEHVVLFLALIALVHFVK